MPLTGQGVFIATNESARVRRSFKGPARGRRSALPWKFDALLLLLILFIQVGYSYWLSVAVLSTPLILIRLRRQLVAGFMRQPWMPAVFLLMFLPIIFERSIDLEHDFLKSAREALFGVLMLLIIGGSRIRPIAVNISKVIGFLGAISIILLILVVIQIGAIKSGVYFGLPEGAYAFGHDTIPGALDLIYSDVRPAATFSEPSYLAFVSISLLVILLSYFHRAKRALRTIIVIIAVGILSRAASFVAFGSLLTGIFLTRIIEGRNKLLILSFLAIGAVGALLIQTTLLNSRLEVVGRLLRGGSSRGDASVFDRLFGPLYLMPDYLPSYPMGLPSSLVARSISAGAREIGTNGPALLMNGFFNLLFQYGFFGFVIATAFLARRDIVISVYLLSCMMFNGAFLSADKFVIVTMTIAIYYSLSSRKRGSIGPQGSKEGGDYAAFPRRSKRKVVGAQIRSEGGL